MVKSVQVQPVSISMRALVMGLVIILALLQWRLWFSAEGWPEVSRLRSGVATQQTQNERMAERNARLQAEVSDLKSGFAALEERARSDLGMIGADESFYLFIPAENEDQAAR
jgi:cell division protein FtsB